MFFFLGLSVCKARALYYCSEQKKRSENSLQNLKKQNNIQFIKCCCEHFTRFEMYVLMNLNNVIKGRKKNTHAHAHALTIVMATFKFKYRRYMCVHVCTQVICILIVDLSIYFFCWTENSNQYFPGTFIPKSRRKRK